MYIVAFISEQIGGFYLAMVAACLMIPGLGSCWLFIAFVNDIKCELNQLNAHKQMRKNESEIYVHLCKIVKFHTKIKQLSLKIDVIDVIIVMIILILVKSILNLYIFFSLFSKFSATYSLVFTSNLVWTVATIALAFTSFQMELVEFNIFYI